MKFTLLITAITVITLVSGCSKNNGCTNNNCEKTILVDNERYQKTSTSNYMIIGAVINGNCLELKFGASGCDSKSWSIEMVDAELVTETPIPNRSLKLNLTNKELCAAPFTKTASFDLTKLRVNGSSKINLLLAGYNESLLYSYK